MSAIVTSHNESNANVFTSDTRIEPSKKALWAGRVMSGLVVAFMTFDGVMKLLKVGPVVEGTEKLGYPQSTIVPIGLLALIGAALYLVRRTSVLGAIFLTGFFGGAIATNVRVENPLFSHVLFPTYLAALMWGGIALRNSHVKQVLFGSR